MGTKLRIYPGKPYGFTHIGGKDNQEDCLYPNLNEITENTLSSLFLICDGVGGRDNGEVASATVCEAFSHFFQEHPLAENEIFTEERFNEALSYAYDQLDTRATDERSSKMATTLAFAMFHAGGCLVAHIGDSRIYQIRPNSKYKIKFQTFDHSYLNMLQQKEEISPEEIANHPLRHMIMRSMQPNQGEKRCEADILNLEEFQEGDYIFLCSDGVLEQIDNETLCTVLSSQETDSQKIERLEQLCKGSYDNYSALLIPIMVKSIDSPSKNIRKIQSWWRNLWK